MYLQDLFIECNTNYLHVIWPPIKTKNRFCLHVVTLSEVLNTVGAVLWNNLPETLKSSNNSLGVLDDQAIYCNKLIWGGGSFGPPTDFPNGCKHIKDQTLACKQLWVS